MHETLLSRALPSVTIWNRVEGRPRTVDFGRALRAEVRDALWLLTRQWQLGEFHGDDAGSPVLAKIQLSRSTLTGFHAEGGTPVAIDDSVPLEAIAERRTLDVFTSGAIDVRLAMGRRFLKSVPPVYHQAFIEQYGFALPNPDALSDTERVAHLEVWSLLAAVAGRAMDGFTLHEHLTADPTHRPWDGMTVLEADKPALTDAGTRFVEWFAGLVQRPTAEPAWRPERLEHAFAVTTGVTDGTKRLAAAEYPGGRLDWTAFSIDPAGARGSGELGEPTSVIPTTTRFTGMPDPRWWAFEDGRTNFGDVRADTTDLAKLLFLEFALVYSNDWYTIPCDLPVGVVAKVEGLAVTNVFGERLWIEAAGRGVDDDWSRWSMYTLDVAGAAPEPADTSLMLPATVPHVSQSEPLEEVVLLRDEIANLVWGVERTVPLATGTGRRGAELATESLAHRRKLLATTPPPVSADPAAPVAYEVMSSVPENWIPFVAVHMLGEVRSTQLQRAAMPRLFRGHATGTVRPRTSLLRVGLDAVPARPYHLHEEEVPRAGTQVTIAYQRTRWRDGRPVIWLAAHRQTGRGEGYGGLLFDQLVPEPPPDAP
ncbi:MAG: hypothetical protein HOV94_44495 [Saccharothrix sp.]|nr:hypothetical protein [Saccharothrix sp.]